MSSAGGSAPSEAGPARPRGARLDWLTALRFFAAFAVILCHLAAPFHVRGRGHDALVFGQFGVDFFFVLSGFVLTWSRKAQRGRSRFFWLRFARVWPLHMAVIVALVLLGVRAPWGESLLQIALLQQWNPHGVFTEGINGVSWTLSVEAFFYAMFPWLVTRMSRMNVRALAVTSVALWLAHLALILISHGWPQTLKDWVTFSNPAVRLPQFVIGIAIALLLERCDHSPVPPRLLRGLQALSLLLLALGWAGYVVSGGGHIAWWTWILTPVMALVVASFAWAGATLGDTAPRALVMLGEWSFALYLVHRGLVYAHVFPHTQGWPAWVSIPTAIVLAIGVAGIAHECFEKPVERWLRARGPRETTSTPRS